jgi:hypothetical protein
MKRDTIAVAIESESDPESHEYQTLKRQRRGQGQSLTKALSRASRALQRRLQGLSRALKGLQGTSRALQRRLQGPYKGAFKGLQKGIWTLLHPSFRQLQCSPGIEELEKAASDPRFVLDFAMSTNSGKILAHAGDAILRHLLDWQTQRYKVGYTHQPHTRFYANYKDTYLKYKNMGKPQPLLEFGF